MVEIVNIVLEEMLNKVEDREIQIELNKSAKEFVADRGFDPVYGARPLRRTIQRYIEDPIAEDILRGKFADGSQIAVKKKGDQLEFTETSRKKIQLKKNESKQKPKAQEIEP